MTVPQTWPAPAYPLHGAAYPAGGVAAVAVVLGHSGLVALWLAYSLWMLARFVTLTLRARGSRWMVPGPSRR